MPNLARAVQEGHYAKKQFSSKAGLISWGHKRRFQVAVDLAREFVGKRLLDYGSGDGTFLAMLAAEPFAPAEAVGAELFAHTVDECNKRLGEGAQLRFVLVDDLDQQGQFDGIYCMEVLEHVVDKDPILDRLARLLAPQGKLIVSVPVETGLPLLVKQAARRVAGWRGLGDYPGIAPYTAGEYVASIFAGRKQHISRPVFQGEGGTTHHDHKGFNWMALQTELERRFRVISVMSSPVTSFSPHLGSQAWFVLGKK